MSGHGETSTATPVGSVVADAAPAAGAVATLGVAVAVAVAVAMWRGGRRPLVALGGAAHLRRKPWRGRGLWSRQAAAGGPRDGERVRVVVAQVAALLRAGAPPGAAWTRAAGVPVDGLGVPDVEALAPVVGAGHARAVAAATRLALTVGAPLGRVLVTVSDALAAQAEADAEREAALAGPRATARVLLWLPAAGALLGWALGADPFGTATDGGLGTTAVCAGLLLLVAGRWWTARLVETARRAGTDP